MGFFRNLLLSMLNEKTHETIVTKQSLPLLHAIDTFLYIHNTQVAEDDDEALTRDDVIESALNSFMKRNMWIYGKEHKQEMDTQQEKPKEQPSKVVNIRDKRPTIHFTTGRSQARS